jgi:hypothetical protein
LAAGHSRYASTIDHVHACAARLADLRDHAIRLMKWGGWHGLHRCCKGKAKAIATNLIIDFLPF